MPGSDNWSGAETWAWNRIRGDRIADFHALHGPLDPKEPTGWDDAANDRRLSEAFLETILAEEPYRSTISRQGVRIVGAHFSGPVDLFNVRIDHPLMIRGCRFERAVNLSCMKVNGPMSLDGSAFSGPVTMERIDVVGDLFIGRQASFSRGLQLFGANISGQIDMLRSTFAGPIVMAQMEVGDSVFMGSDESGGKSTFKGEVILRGTKVSNTLEMTGSTFEGNVDMAGLRVGAHLFMRCGANFAGDVRLVDAKVGGHLEMAGSTCQGKVHMDGLKVAQVLFLQSNKQYGKSTFKGDVILRGTKVGGQLAMGASTFERAFIMDGVEIGDSLLMPRDEHCGENIFNGDVIIRGTKVAGDFAMDGAYCSGKLTMRNLEVRGVVFMRSATFKRPVEIIFSTVGASLDLCDANLKTLDLTSTRVEGELRLGSAERSPCRWAEDSQLVLRNAHVRALQDREDAWPAHLVLDGFSYERLGGFGSEGAESDMARRNITWFKEWLERVTSFSPQPYRQLANVLRTMGHSDKANAILYAGRERERREAWESRSLGKWLGMSLLNYIIGYGLGFRYFFSLGWVALLTLTGALVLAGSGVAEEKGIFWISFCSFDVLLPLIELKAAYGKFVQNDLPRWAEIYFYFHKLAGWLLASFLVAGLGGLTQK